jgi:hypothetical protein
MGPPPTGDPINWFALLDLLVPFGVVFVGLVWYDHKLRRERRAARHARETAKNSPRN